MRAGPAILDELSPNGRWRLEIYMESGYHCAHFRNVDGTVGCCADITLAFGVYDSPTSSTVTLNWALPDNIVGVYVDGQCFGLFRCGAGRRRSRGKFSIGRPLTSEEINYFCAR